MCLWNSQYFSHNSSWSDECNTCTCINGKVRCTRIWCGPGNCMERPSLCHPNQVCVPAAREACLAPGCEAWGECRDLGSGKRVGLPEMPAPPDCWPNQARLSNTCARLSLLFDRAKLPRGTTVEGVCVHLRRLTAKHQALAGATDPLVILCDLKAGYNDTVEVTMVSTVFWFLSN